MEDDRDRRVSGFLIVAEDGSTRWLGPDDVAAELRNMVGRRLAGGCLDCGASWTEIVEDDDLPGLFHNLIHHDETCPQLRQGVDVEA